MGKFNIATLGFQKFTKSIKMQIEFEKQLNELKAITGKNIDGNEQIKALVNWFRKEFEKRPEKYVGDHIPIKITRDYVAKGYNLDLALKETYSKLIGEFEIIDRMRAMGK